MKTQAANAPKTVTVAGERLTMSYIPIDDLVPYERNSRKHPARQIESLRAAIRQLGFGTALGVWQGNMILAGHGRVQAAKLEGFTELPCLDLSHLTLEQARAFVISDNKISDLASWDETILKAELIAIDAGGDTGIDLDALGFSGRELGRLVEDYEVPDGRKTSTHAPDSRDPEVAALEGPAITAEGQLWQLGDHRLMCGDSTSAENWTRIMDGAQAQLLFTDPPYGVSYSEKAAYMNSAGIGGGRGFNSGLIANDSLNDADLTAFLTQIFTALRAVMSPGCPYYICGPGGDKGYAIMLAMVASDMPVRDSLAWAKNRSVFGRSDYHYKHEMILYGHVDGPHRFYGPVDADTLREFDVPQASALHPTMKPVELIERALVNSTLPGDIVVDAFGGSGSTLMACERRGRAARLIELSPDYCDRILRRWRLATGGDPLRSDGAALSELEAEQGYTYAPAAAMDPAPLEDAA